MYTVYKNVETDIYLQEKNILQSTIVQLQNKLKRKKEKIKYLKGENNKLRLNNKNLKN